MNLAGLGQVILLIVGLYLGNAVLSGMGFYLMSVAGYKMLRNLQEELFHHIHRLSLGYFTKHEAGDVMSRVTNDIDTLQQIIGFGLLSVIQGTLLIVMIVLAMFGSSVPYALVSLSILPLMFVATRWFSAQARSAFRQARKEIGGVNANLQENIAAVREVQAFSREDENIEQFRSSNAANAGRQHPRPGVQQRPGPHAGGAGLRQYRHCGGAGWLLYPDQPELFRHDHFAGADHHLCGLRAAV
jgi:ATP-binding cassette, subfamily B, multidrug efflux pump